jgi:hypothetical protein
MTDERMSWIDHTDILGVDDANDYIPVFTNSSGFTSVDMDQYFNTSGAENTTGYFDIVVKYNNKTANGYSRCRIHTTSVETIYLPN